MITIRRLIAALVAAAAAAAVGLAGTATGSSTSSAHWICVYVDHVHITVCQDKPIDFYPEDTSVGGALPAL